MNILHLSTYLQGGAGKVVLDLAKKSKEKGMLVEVGYTKMSVKGYCNYPKHLNALRKAKINQIELPTTFDRTPLKIIDSAKLLLERFRKIPFDLIHCHAANPSRIALEFRKLANLEIPVIQTMHGWGIYKTPAQEIEDIETLNKLDHVVSISKSSDSLLRKKGLINPRTSIIYNGIEEFQYTNEFSDDKDLSDLRRLKKTGHFIVGIVGTIDERKNQKLVLNAIRQLPPDLKIKFYFVGEGEIKKLSNFANGCGISELVHFTGYNKNAREFIWAFDLLICSSKSEGGPPICLMEAFASKTPVLASDTPEHIEAVKNQCTGFTFRSMDEKDLAEKIIKIHNTRKFEKIEEKAYQFFREHFLFSKTFSSYDLLFQRLIS